MVDVLFALIFAPMVQVMADDSKTYFSKVVCDNGEMVLPLSHVLTHYDLEVAAKVRAMLNENLCDADAQKRCHMSQIDYFVK